MRYYLDDIRPKYSLGGDIIAYLKNLYNQLFYTDTVKKKENKDIPENIRIARNLAAQTNSIPVTLNYGDDDKVRSQVWQEEPVLRHAVDSIGKAYDINPYLIANRLNEEGIIDSKVRYRNRQLLAGLPEDIQRGYALLNSLGDSGFHFYGLDDAGTYINKGDARLINEKWYEENNKNESGRQVVSATGKTMADNIGIVAALLKMFRNQAKEDFPGRSEAEYDEMAAAYYNAGRGGGRRYVRSGKKKKKYSIRNTYASGGSIHIKPENRGKFTETMRRTGKTAEELKHSSNPLTRKRATFAINARKWKH